MMRWKWTWLIGLVSIGGAVLLAQGAYVKPPERPGYYYIEEGVEIDSVTMAPDGGMIYVVQRPRLSRDMVLLYVYLPGSSEPHLRMIFCTPTVAKKLAEAEDPLQSPQSP